MPIYQVSSDCCVHCTDTEWPREEDQHVVVQMSRDRTKPQCQPTAVSLVNSLSVGKAAIGVIAVRECECGASDLRHQTLTRTSMLHVILLDRLSPSP